MHHLHTLMASIIAAIVITVPTVAAPFSGHVSITRTVVPARHNGRMPTRSATARTPLLAMVVRGNVYVLLADGHSQRLAHAANASRPLLSPDGRFVAYIGARYGTANRPAAPFAGWIVSTAANARSTPIRLSAGSNALGRADTAMAWSPDGIALAYSAGNTIVIRSIVGTQSEITLRSLKGLAFSAPLRWSPDGHQLAVPLMPLGLQTPPTQFRIGIYDLASRRWTRITARFLPGALGSWPGGLTRSSAAGDISWAPAGQGFFFGTDFAGEGGPRLSGLWQVGIRGGMSQLIVGTAAAVRDGTVLQTSPLYGATHWTFSPNNRLIATDPARGLWVADPRGKHGRLLNVPLPRNCLIAAYQWLRDSRGLAYLRMCTMPGSLDVQSSLYTRPLNGGAHLIMQLRSGEEFPIEIEGAHNRCVFCGA